MRPPLPCNRAVSPVFGTEALTSKNGSVVRIPCWSVGSTATSPPPAQPTAGDGKSRFSTGITFCAVTGKVFSTSPKILISELRISRENRREASFWETIAEK